MVEADKCGTADVLETSFTWSPDARLPYTMGHGFRIQVCVLLKLTFFSLMISRLGGLRRISTRSAGRCTIGC